MRKPRMPRPPREPRQGDGETAASAAPTAIPPPGFSKPIPGFSFGASSGPMPPRRAFVASAPAAAPAAARPYMPPDQPAAAPPAEEYSPPAGPAIAAQTTNEFAASAAQRQYWDTRSTRRSQPQGETQLAHAWLNVITIRKIPPHACTIWLTRVEPQPTYEFYIPGDAVVGEHPDRAIYEYLAANRRQRDVAERFVGRIKAPAQDGSAIELGGGEIYLPPAAPAAAAPGWTPPGAGMPYGAPGMQAPPWAQMPWWMQPPMGGMGGMGMGGPPGMPPWWGPSAPPLGALMMGAGQTPPAPAAVQQDPVAMKAWQMMSENNQQLTRSLLEFAFRPQAVPAAAAPPPDPWAMIERVLSIQDKFRGPAQEAAGPSVQVIKLDEDTTLVTDKNGNINTGATAWANAKTVKSVLSGIRNLRPQSAGGGPQPPRRQGLPGANGVPEKPNGVVS